MQFKKAPEVLLPRHPGVGSLEPNRLIFHIQPDQGIELRFQAKRPGPSMSLQKVNMRFDYQRGVRGLAQHRLRGAALQLHARRRDAVHAHRPGRDGLAHRPADPGHLGGESAAATSRTTRPAPGARRRRFDLIERDGRKWLEVINRAVLEKVPLFAGCSAVFLHGLALVLKPAVYAAGDTIVTKGEPGSEMYFVARGEVEVVDGGRS